MKETITVVIFLIATVVIIALAGCTLKGLDSNVKVDKVSVGVLNVENLDSTLKIEEAKTE